MGLSSSEIAGRIDHTLLRADAREAEIRKLCQQAKKYGFKAVCVQPCHVELCVKELLDSGVDVVAVVGFPLGSNCPEVKAYEAKKAFAQGAREVDMVMNIGALKDGKLEKVYEDIHGVVEISSFHAETLVKVIIETALLTNAEKVLACETAVQAGAQYVKTSTGFGGSGATVEDIRLMVKAVDGEAKIKASGGIKTRQHAEMMLAAGADRLGTSSGVTIVAEGDN